MTYDNFTANAQDAIIKGQRLAASLDQMGVGTCHLLYGVIEQDPKLIEYLFQKSEISLTMFKRELYKIIEKYPKPESVDKQFLSKDANAALLKAKKSLAEWGDEFISLELMFLGLVDSEDIVGKLYKSMGGELPKTKDAIKELRNGKKVTKQNADNQYNALKNYAINLNEKALDGSLDTIIGRDDEIRRLLHILSRRSKNNPILVGDAGVGKTAIVEGLAWRIVKQDVPENLKTKQIYVLDITSIVAGAKFKGEFEERIKGVVDEVKSSNGEVILFIDEIHSLIGAGGGNGAMDAANILKPALARGEMQIIGATTPDEYQKYFEQDKALVRRFQNVVIDEPTIEETVSILRGVQEKYEVYHKIGIKDDALVAAAELSHRYIIERRLPDKALDLIDEAASKLRMELDSVPDEIDELERKINQLNIEREYLKKEKNEKTLTEITAQISNLREQLDSQKAGWKTEKDLIQQIQNTKTQLDELRRQLDIADRESDTPKAAELKYEGIKKLEETLVELESKLGTIPAEQRMTNDEVTADDVADVVSKWTGIPVNKMLQSDKARLLNLEAEIGKRLIGQKEAVGAVCDAVRRSRAGLQDPNKPVGSFIFLGPTGVGKTELAKALAEVLFDDENAITRIDMSEYQEKHSVSRLVGAPPGYVGYDEGGQLTEAVRRRPYTIVLLDEIEKAHPDTFNILLQLLDDGRLTDNKGRVANFRNTIVIMTSNMGAEVILENFEDLEAVGEDHRADILETTKNEVFELLKQNLRPEFLNRIDEKIMFLPLTKAEIKQIGNLMLKKVKKNLVRQEIKIEFTDKAMDLLTEMGYDPQFGARPMKRVIDKELINVLAREILGGDYGAGDTIYVGTNKQGFTFTKTKPENEEVPPTPPAEAPAEKRENQVKKLEQATKEVEKAVEEIKKEG
ncbi:MAG: AAA family ATPase [Saprospiraceae bacterium]|nr:AAA family ATPase [Saprospiraceae bacterium]MBP7642620.1 AAA family ATPase [Saprospiraceae bacterium]